ncbi:MAG: NAD(P)/FAD-dependent oxidoreductase [Candidatus Delongbacteria bacterium]|nr:NAD(P)/FAD-dependent oxidoreductase [Candidatus Delongbacteria bacterium]
MGYKEVELKLPTDYNEGQLIRRISKKLSIREFSFQIENKSLDARKKDNIYWLVRCSVISDELKEEEHRLRPEMNIPYKKKEQNIIVVGSGPGGLFSALTLQKAGFKVTILERGTDVKKRTSGIINFEATRNFDPISNYAFGEGGAGTFSDGKLTSRSKHINLERQFIISNYISAGAPEEISYMKHPHLGSDNLKVIVKNLRKKFEELGGKVMFETEVKDIKTVNGAVTEVITNAGNLEADHFFFAIGHSAYDTYKMLISNGIQFRTKNFAIGSRVEHPQKLINLAQWGREELPGVKAAEYRLTSKGPNGEPVFTFCMCPGGDIVPAGAFSNTNIVNGMSRYKRNGEYANSAVVVGVDPNVLLKKEASATEILNYVELLENKFYDFSTEYKAPFSMIEDFMISKETDHMPCSSYILGLKSAPLWDMLPFEIIESMRVGLKDFSKKLKGFEKGKLIGLESKTSAPIQVVREQNGLCAGFSNLYMIGEGSGFAGGIISSAADGIKAAMGLMKN